MVPKRPWYRINMRYLIVLLGLLIITFFGTDQGKSPKEKPVYDFDSNRTYLVLAAIDGDTLIIETETGEEKVRLIGIDTPEVDPARGGPECYGAEASKRTKELTSQKTVTIELDESQGMRDTYGRLLAYVRLPDGSLLNEVLVAEGFAREYTYNQPYRYQKEFKQAQKLSQSEKSGLWADCFDN